MNEIKPATSVKTADQEMSEWMKSKQTTSMTYGELYTFFERKEVKKLRAACEALQKENETLSTNIELLNTQILCLDSIVNRQAKRIAELELMNSEVK